MSKKTNPTIRIQYHARRVFALVEADVPYEMKVLLDGSFETMAKESYGGKISVSL
jgi:hypothetical protein